MLILVGILFGSLFFYQIIKAKMIKKYIAKKETSLVTVSTMAAEKQPWQSTINAVGSLRAIRGVNVTTELAGLVKTIYFSPGSTVKKGTLLVKLNDELEQAQLASLEASKSLAYITYKRDLELIKAKAISQQTLDNDKASLDNLMAQVKAQRAIIEKKHIHAPFSGRLGITLINPGQFINVGDPIVSLQALDPLYVDFYIPQQYLFKLAIGQKIQMSLDVVSDESFSGKITTIDPAVDVQTRNVRVEAIIANPEKKLLPGMFTNVEITTGKDTPFITIPKTAVSFNPYGEIVFIIQEKKNEKSDDTIFIANQSFVTVGEARGDQVAILKGLKEGDQVVVGGQLKIKNGTQVRINNSVLPSNNPHPQAKNE